MHRIISVQGKDPLKRMLSLSLRLKFISINVLFTCLRFQTVTQPFRDLSLSVLKKNSTIDAANSNKLSVNVMQQLVVHNRKDPCLSIWRRNEFWMLDAFWRISFATYKPIMRRRKGEK